MVAFIQTEHFDPCLFHRRNQIKTAVIYFLCLVFCQALVCACSTLLTCIFLHSLKSCHGTVQCLISCNRDCLWLF